MCPFLDLFETITYYDQSLPNSPKVMMGNESTVLPIHGYGFIKVRIHTKAIRVKALYVPSMGNTCLYSIKQHSKFQGYTFFAKAQNTAVTFPTFVIYPRVTSEIDVLMSKSHPTDTISFDEATNVELNIINKTSRTQNKTMSPGNINLISSSKIPFIPKSQHHLFKETVLVQKLVSHTTIPKQATPGSVGFDVTSAVNLVIHPGKIAKVPTGLSTAMPPGMYCRITPRSSLALQHLTVEGGGRFRL
jgi:hypothetical protein